MVDVDLEELDDEVRADSKSAPAVVIFNEPKPERSLPSRDGMKNFMVWHLDIESSLQLTQSG
jgi:hypothetical protein